MSLQQKANLILGLAAIAYALVFIAQFFYGGPLFEALYWCVQSALIGSVADWFAVTALFRKPLGFPYHTALIPRKKEKLVNGIVSLVETRLLTLNQWQNLVKDFRITPILNNYLTSEVGRQNLRKILHKGLRMIMLAKTPEEWAHLAGIKISEFAEQQTATPYIRRILLQVCEDETYEKNITEVANFIQKELYKPEFQTWISSIIADVIDSKKENLGTGFLLSLGEIFDVVNVSDMTASVTTELDRLLEEWKNPRSSLRRTCMNEWVGLIRQMDVQNPTGLVIEAVYKKWLRSQSIEEILLTYIWPHLEEGLGGETYNPDIHNLTTRVEVVINRLWCEYGSDELVQQKMEHIFQELLKDMLTSAHRMVGVIVKHVLNGFSIERFNAFIESKVEDDLSWIRINGALVGAVIGLLVWAFLYFLYDPILKSFL